MQPSTLAASSTSLGTEVNPASRTIAENGNVRHTFTQHARDQREAGIARATPATRRSRTLR